jgi:hypothetical protein
MEKTQARMMTTHFSKKLSLAPAGGLQVFKIVQRVQGIKPPGKIRLGAVCVLTQISFYTMMKERAMNFWPDMVCWP